MLFSKKYKNSHELWSDIILKKNLKGCIKFIEKKLDKGVLGDKNFGFYDLRVLEVVAKMALGVNFHNSKQLARLLNENVIPVIMNDLERQKENTYLFHLSLVGLKAMHQNLATSHDDVRFELSVVGFVLTYLLYKNGYDIDSQYLESAKNYEEKAVNLLFGLMKENVNQDLSKEFKKPQEEIDVFKDLLK